MFVYSLSLSLLSRFEAHFTSNKKFRFTVTVLITMVKCDKYIIIALDTIMIIVIQSQPVTQWLGSKEGDSLLLRFCPPACSVLFH